MSKPDEKNIGTESTQIDPVLSVADVQIADNELRLPVVKSAMLESLKGEREKAQKDAGKVLSKELGSVRANVSQIVPEAMTQMPQELGCLVGRKVKDGFLEGGAAEVLARLNLAAKNNALLGQDVSVTENQTQGVMETFAAAAKRFNPTTEEMERFNTPFLPLAEAQREYQLWKQILSQARNALAMILRDKMSWHDAGMWIVARLEQSPNAAVRQLVEGAESGNTVEDIFDALLSKTIAPEGQKTDFEHKLEGLKTKAIAKLEKALSGIQNDQLRKAAVLEIVELLCELVVLARNNTADMTVESISGVVGEKLSDEEFGSLLANPVKYLQSIAIKDKMEKKDDQMVVAGLHGVVSLRIKKPNGEFLECNPSQVLKDKASIAAFEEFVKTNPLKGATAIRAEAMLQTLRVLRPPYTVRARARLDKDSTDWYSIQIKGIKGPNVEVVLDESAPKKAKKAWLGYSKYNTMHPLGITKIGDLFRVLDTHFVLENGSSEAPKVINVRTNEQGRD